jgi:AcrR family transcriptional regulator
MGSTDARTASAADAALRALLELCAEKSYQKISVAAIAARAGMDRATFYRHFEDKDMCVHTLYRHVLDEFVSRFRRSGSQDMDAYLLFMFQTLRSHRSELLCLYKAGAAFLLLDELKHAFGLERAAKAEDSRLQYALAYHVGGIYADLLVWFSRDMEESPEDMRDVARTVRPEGAFTLLDF